MKHISFQSEGSMGILIVNRPEALNALNREVLRELYDFFYEVLPGEKVRGIILTGAGEKAFIAGADIKEMNKMSLEEIHEFIDLGQQVTSLMENSPTVSIAAVNGYALGGGLEMALACDFIYASQNAKLGLPETTLGLIPGFGGTQRLSRAIGERLAKEMIYTGKTISAEEALNIGLVNKIASQDNLLEEARNTLLRILENGYFAVRQAKQVIHHGMFTDIYSGMQLEKNAFTTVFQHEDRREGITAFIEKRKAKFM